MNDDPLLLVRNLKKYFPLRRSILSRARDFVRAVDGVSLTVHAGETLGIVGESGCGKTTLGRLVLRLIDPDAGSIQFAGRDLTRLHGGAMRAMRRFLQVVFQDPYGSLNPRFTVAGIIAEPIRNFENLSRQQIAKRVDELVEVVGLPSDAPRRYPHEFSGGQRQRIAIARALALKPKLVVCDEPVSALDVSIQAQILNLLQELQARFGLSYIFISHDLAVVEHISHRIAVMYLGRIVEQGSRDAIRDRPCHPYTRALFSANPLPDPDAISERIILRGDVPSAARPPAGCPFHPRCPLMEQPRCTHETQALQGLGDDHHVRCWKAVSGQAATSSPG